MLTNHIHRVVENRHILLRQQLVVVVVVVVEEVVVVVVVVEVEVEVVVEVLPWREVDQQHRQEQEHDRF